MCSVIYTGAINELLLVGKAEALERSVGAWERVPATTELRGILPSHILLRRMLPW